MNWFVKDVIDYLVPMVVVQQMLLIGVQYLAG